MQRSRQQILEILKKKGKATLDELATRVGLAPITVRAHLSVLERDHLVTSEEVRGKVGRPFYVYSLTEKANELFPRDYDLLSDRILNHLRSQSGPVALTSLFEEIADEVARGYAARVIGADLRARLAEVARLMEGEGRLSDWEQTTEGLMLYGYNCPYYRVARSHPEVCDLDRNLFAKLLRADVLHVERMASGDSRCSYLIGKER